jgi:putative DNA-invertase from lambdoid prophage Rac
MRVFGYGRVSTTDQTASNQLQELQQQLGFEIEPHRWFAETVSGGVPSSERKGFNKLLERLEAGDLLVVSKLDRIGRDALDVVSTIRRLAEKGIKVKVLALGDVDLTSTAGKAILGILATVAELEKDLIIERTKAGLARAKAEGKQLGRKSKTSASDRQIIRERLSEGVTVSQLARDYGISRASVITIRKTT